MTGQPVRFAGIALAMLIGYGTSASVAVAQQGAQFNTNAQPIVCTDIGTQVQCTGRVTGLGGTTFEIVVTAVGQGIVECTNPAGNVAPGQTFETDVTGTTDPLPTPRNGNYRFTVLTDAPVAPPNSCPNPKWTAEVVDVTFTTANLYLYEDGVLVDEELGVPVN